MRTMKTMHMLLRLWRDRLGVAATEFALSLPFLMLLFMGGVELGRMMIVYQKVEKTASTIADLVAQSQDLTAEEMENILTASSQVMDPFSFGMDGVVIVSSVSRGPDEEDQATVSWQQGGGGTLEQGSGIGTPGMFAELPYGFELNNSDNIIVAEVYYRFRPLMSETITGEQIIRKTAIYKPRLGNMTNPPS